MIHDITTDTQTRQHLLRCASGWSNRNIPTLVNVFFMQRALTQSDITQRAFTGKNFLRIQLADGHCHAWRYIAAEL